MARCASDMIPGWCYLVASISPTNRYCPLSLISLSYYTSLSKWNMNCYYVFFLSRCWRLWMASRRGHSSYPQVSIFYKYVLFNCGTLLIDSVLTICFYSEKGWPLEDKTDAYEKRISSLSKKVKQYIFFFPYDYGQAVLCLFAGHMHTFIKKRKYHICLLHTFPL